MADRPWLEAGRTCWRSETASRASVLVDAEAYFAAAAALLDAARRSVWILGWTFDTRTRLRLGGGEGTIGERLAALAEVGVEVRVLVWRSAPPIAATQGFYPQRAARDLRATRVRFQLDDAHPFGACHHQKLLVVDETLALCGGGDFAPDRWDTPAHLDADARRRQASGRAHAPRHEVMMLVEGAPARALADLARARWLRATRESLSAPPPGEAPVWPAAIAAELRNARVGLALTAPGGVDQPAVREAEALHLRAIAGARRCIYLENQYVTATALADALAKRLAEPDGPEVVVVTTRHSPSWFDRATMDRARDTFLKRLRAADRHGRFHAYCPLTPAGGTVIVHSKVSIIDDRLLRVGSANLNNRSAGFDTECDLAVEAADARARTAVVEVRDRLIAHFLAVSPESFSRAARAHGVARAIAVLDQGPTRRLAPLAPRARAPLAAAVARWGIGDPVEPRDSWRPWTRAAAIERQRARLAASLPDRTPKLGSERSSKSIVKGR